MSPPGDNPGQHYVGRFAPSPTGPLHAGSLVAALASYLDARHRSGAWHLRIDDIDPPRAMPGAQDRIVTTLAHHGLNWDGAVDQQSNHGDYYDAAIAILDDTGLVFHCYCTRRNLGPSGTCISDCAITKRSSALSPSLRVSVAAETTIAFTDRFLGPQRFPLGQQLANFIIRRRDGLYAYQLAAAVDDSDGVITDVVRGADLMPSTPRQIYLQQLLGRTSPRYGHVPVVEGCDGHKLSKQTGAQSLVDDHCLQNLRQALHFLKQPTPPEQCATTASILQWSVTNWAPTALNR